MSNIHAGDTLPHSEIPATALSGLNHPSMLRSIKQLYGHSLGTAEGEIGTVKDFYFDDQHWAVRYVVVDTGAWLSGRLVLISPHAFGSFYEDGDSLLVNLSRQQIENSPSVETHKPVSRQFEEEYYRYYGWPTYWAGTGMWGTGGFPMVPPPILVPIQEQTSDTDFVQSDDSHLRSTMELSGYHIETPEGAIGHISDFVMDTNNWAIRHLVVETGHWFAGKDIVLSPTDVQSISYDDSKVFVNVTKESIREAPEYHLPQPPYHDSKNFN